ncbi:MAG: hypothetical protein OHK0012_23450 [Synechococcales cyanobacterium]
MTEGQPQKISIELLHQDDADNIIVKFLSKENDYKFISLSKFIKHFIHHLNQNHGHGMSSSIGMNYDAVSKVNVFGTGYKLQILWPNQPWMTGQVKATVSIEFITDPPSPMIPDPSLLDDLRQDSID